MTEAWNGRTWKIESTPLPHKAAGGALSGVSCLSAAACTAVGAYNFPGTTLVESWHGKTWSIQSSPNRGAESILNSVSCPSAKVCAAVGDSCAGNGCGYASGSALFSVLAEGRNGAIWSVTDPRQRGVVPAVTKVDPASEPLGRGATVDVS